MLCALANLPLFIGKTFAETKIPTSTPSIVVCAAKGPRPRYPRVWKTNKKIGTISKAAKLVQSIKELSNVKEEVYGALDTYVAWELEFPLITVKKAVKTLEYEKEWKRIIQVTKWMLSKGQGKTMGSYYTLINALAEDDRLDEAEELWTKLLMQYTESLPRRFFDKMISIYNKRRMHDKMFEVFADMEELSVKPSSSVVSMVGDVFKELGMMEKYEKLHKKYPPSQWEYKYIKGKRVRFRVQGQSNQVDKYIRKHDNVQSDSDIRQDDSSEETSEVIDDEQFEQDADVIFIETKQISDESYQSMEPSLDVSREKDDIL
ncbi:pentatricopeptide repeat-containing protein At4g21190-like [Vicia villosa]|uniref:pentatricopeptide repeat-containing protein At4g21190-like n=1 Tax=Vicia villosa TaxID=3911 RepID=UPI00273AB145|nr:pentatricopeptide repeat-containing protein At4g21190-like [Vicia villosa]XP_058763371.1 pentatricopeptide repeat-containing protein At4g21190-like [Vicia villosa]